jgi:hypothetical protein
VGHDSGLSLSTRCTIRRLAQDTPFSFKIDDLQRLDARRTRDSHIRLALLENSLKINFDALYSLTL